MYLEDTVMVIKDRPGDRLSVFDGKIAQIDGAKILVTWNDRDWLFSQWFSLKTLKSKNERNVRLHVLNRFEILFEELWIY